MILSNVSLLKAIENGWIGIDPHPEPRTGPDSPFQTSAVDIRLGDEIAWFKKDQLPATIDLGSGKFMSLYEAACERRTLRDDDPYTLAPNAFILSKTLERISLPIQDNAPCYAARIEGRSSFARSGLLVHFTAPTIHSGFEGTITLEIMNLGPYPILLRKGMRIAQLIFEQVDGTPLRKDSQFQGQSTPGGVRS